MIQVGNLVLLFISFLTVTKFLSSFSPSVIYEKRIIVPILKDRKIKLASNILKAFKVLNVGYYYSD